MSDEKKPSEPYKAEISKLLDLAKFAMPIGIVTGKQKLQE